MLSHFKFETTANKAAEALSTNIKGKTVLITGATIGGLGFETARAISHHSPKLLILAGRNSKNNDDAKAALLKESPDVEVRTLLLDLGSFAKVREAAEVVRGWDEGLVVDVLVNNAAIKYNKTVDGIEDKFATNHLGVFLFTNLILDRMIKAGAGARIIVLSSRGHQRSEIRWDNWNWSDGKTYDAPQAYGQSKTANILFAVFLALKLISKGILAYSVHPGGIATNLGRQLPVEELRKMGVLNKDDKPIDTAYLRWKSIPQGASRTVVAAFDPSIVDRSGAYLQDGHIDDEAVAAYASDMGNAEKLWKVSEELVGQEFSL
ncbi:short-chain dehydrogenase [Tothia fuscella]|uniref:Short-chain dehydrogenase n=1 Tax=Tothia fuscella TaxID=1048955 RepID=A0A9P4TWX5_9PEZI|nr:short-chain dehydrogenase [Tothia fuscella]